VFSFVFPAVQVNYARKRTFVAAFYLREVFRLVGDNLGGYILAWLAYFVFALVAGAVLGFIGTILGWIPCVGWILSLAATALVTPLILVVYSHLFGQLGEEDQAGGELVPAA
jgi:ABC-type bacteriocin/lantibiotic exporter with double-glycine peptidase domain